MRKLILLIPILIMTLVAVKGQGIDKPIYQIETYRSGTFLGDFTVELFPLIAPLHVQNFDSLVNDQFYDSTAFHRVVPGFVIQGGDPNSINGPISTWGQGQPWQVTVPAEFSVVRHLRGILGAARSIDTNSATSQFYICVANSTFLDGNYTVYGQVTNGMDVVDTIVASPRDANDNPLQKIEMFISYVGVNDSVPDVPVLTAPADGATGILNVQSFIWSSVYSAVMNTIEFSTDPAFSTIDITANAGTNSAIVPAISGNTTYYWRVKSNNGGHESAYSQVRTLTTASGAAQLVYPADASTNIPVNLNFEWDPVNGADNYTLQVSTSATFTTQSMVYNTSGLTGTTQLVTGLNPNTLYYWRVRSANGSTQGFYSVKWSFTTGTSTGLNDINNAMQILDLFPNPSTNEFNISVRLKTAGELSLSIMDMPGKLIYEEQESLGSGSYVFNIKTSEIAPGMYFLNIIFNDALITRRIIIQ